MRALPSALLDLLLTAACLCALFAAVACYAPPDPPDCGTVCDRQEAHDALFTDAALALTAYTPEQLQLAGWRVKLHPRPLYDDNGRAYFTDSRYPDFRIWGLADCETRIIWLADLDYASGVLSHEYGHALEGDGRAPEFCGFGDHERFATNGIDAVTRLVQSEFEAAALRVPSDPSEGCPLAMASITGASGGSP